MRAFVLKNKCGVEREGQVVWREMSLSVCSPPRLDSLLRPFYLLVYETCPLFHVSLLHPARSVQSLTSKPLASAVWNLPPHRSRRDVWLRRSSAGMLGDRYSLGRHIDAPSPIITVNFKSSKFFAGQVGKCRKRSGVEPKGALSKAVLQLVDLKNMWCTLRHLSKLRAHCLLYG